MTCRTASRVTQTPTGSSSTTDYFFIIGFLPQSNDVHVSPTGHRCVIVCSSELKQLGKSSAVAGNVWMDQLMCLK